MPVFQGLFMISIFLYKPNLKKLGTNKKRGSGSLKGTLLTTLQEFHQVQLYQVIITHQLNFMLFYSMKNNEMKTRNGCY